MEPSHILIVEDEPNTAEMLTSYFHAQGYEVTAVGCGKDALAFARKVLPSLVVLDIHLPDMDGYEICRRLRSHRRTAQVPIIFLTERRERIDRLAGLELGAVDYVTKPFDIQELRLRVRNVLQRVNEQTVTHPVTGLFFSTLIDERFAALLQDDQQWAVVAASVEGLESFAEAYGFVARDDVLRAVALIIQHIAEEDGGKEPFIGQLDDKAFCLIVAPDCAGRVRDRLVTRLQEAIAFFYPRVDWEVGQDHHGGQLPRLSFCLGIVAGATAQCADAGALRQAVQESLAPLTP